MIFDRVGGSSKEEFRNLGPFVAVLGVSLYDNLILFR